MPATLPPVDDDVLAGLRLGDEQSLERVFRADFPALVEEAKTQLDDPAGAPRVVEVAFRHAWEERTRFETPQSLEAFLNGAVHDGAARERKRRASLHRLEAGAHVHVTTHAAPATVDQAWAHLAAALHVAPADAEAAAHARATMRHDAATHVAAIGKRSFPIVPIAIGAVLAAAVIAPLWWINQRGTDSAVTRALASSNVRVVSTLPGQLASVTLLDGTKVSLGGDTKLVIVPDFGSPMRAVKLEGTSVFTAAAGQKRPFQVRAGNSTVTAAGTTFGVRAFPDDENVTVSTREGSVTVKSPADTRTVAAGQAVVVAKSGAMREPTAGELESALGWTDGRLVITDRPLREVIFDMSRWYAYDLKVRDSTLLNRRITLSASLQSPGDAIAALERSGNLKFGYDEGRVMVLRDAAAPKK